MESKTFQFVVDLEDLIYLGIEGLNGRLQSNLDEAGLEEYATDIDYIPVGVTATGEVIIEASYILINKDEEEQA